MHPVSLVSCAGPDDRNDPVSVAAAAAGQPLMEVAVQISAQRQGAARYPSRDWLIRFAAAASARRCRAAVHINGRWCRDMLTGSIPEAVSGLLQAVRRDGRLVFERVQLNFDAGRDPANVPGILGLIARLSPRRVILQYNDANEALIGELQDAGASFDVLFDASMGLGVTPCEWPSPLEGLFCAYAGGFTPENAAPRLRDIGPLQRAPFGIDAESGLRRPCHSGDMFDPARACAFVREALQWNESLRADRPG